MLNLIAQDLADGEGLALLDPHGDLAEAVLMHVPRSRTNDLIYVNPADVERPIGFNPLSAVPEDLKPSSPTVSFPPSAMCGPRAGDRASITFSPMRYARCSTCPGRPC